MRCSPAKIFVGEIMLFERLPDSRSSRWLVLPGLLVIVLWLALDHGPSQTLSDALSQAAEDDRWNRMLGASDLGRYQPTLTERLSLQFMGPATQLHWVVTACNRTAFSRTLSSTLLLGLLNDVRPTTLTIVWCRSRHESDRIPALFANLRNAVNGRVAYISEHLPRFPSGGLPGTQWATVFTALSMPAVNGRPDLPLLFTEDDVVFTPDMNAKLTDLSYRISQSNQHKPFFMALYNPEHGDNARPAAQRMAEYQAAASKRRRPCRHCSHAGVAHNGPKAYDYGVQGTFASPTIVKYLAAHFAQVLAADYPNPGGHQDWAIQQFLRARMHCSERSISPHENLCEIYKVVPSMVEHVGTFSALFSAGSALSQRFQMSVDFPFTVAFPSQDAPGEW